MPSAGLAPRRIVQLSALLAMLAFLTAQIVAALLPNVPVFVAASAAGLLLDLYLQYRTPVCSRCSARCASTSPSASCCATC